MPTMWKDTIITFFVPELGCPRALEGTRGRLEQRQKTYKGKGTEGGLAEAT